MPPTKAEIVHLLVAHINEATRLTDGDAAGEQIDREIEEALALAKKLEAVCKEDSDGG